LKKIGAKVFELDIEEDLFEVSWKFHSLNLILLDIELPKWME